MRIAVLASEGAPYIKSGGLGGVMEALPAAWPGSLAMRWFASFLTTRRSKKIPP